MTNTEDIPDTTKTSKIVFYLENDSAGQHFLENRILFTNIKRNIKKNINKMR